MKRLICIICGMTVILAGCNFPAGESSSPTEKEAPAPIVEDQAEGDPVPTATTAVLGTATSTQEPQLSPTPEVPEETATPSYPTLPALTSGQPVTITQIRMFDTTTGWGTGYQSDSGAHVLYTEDGGQTWADRTPPEPVSEALDENESVWVHFLDSQTAWVIYAPQHTPPPVQAQVIWRTVDRGLSWEASPPLNVDGMEDFFTPEGYASTDGNHGWLLVHVGAGMSHDYSYLFATEDGGITWERIADPYGIGIQSLHNTGLAFADSQFGWVTKDNLGVMPGAFFEQTTDGGVNWEKVFLPVPTEHDWFNEVSLCKTSSPTFTGNQTGVLIVKCRLQEDIQKNTDWSLTYIYTTSDRGETWEHVRLLSPVEALMFLDTGKGWAFGRDHYLTTDDGSTWALVKSVNWDGSFSYVDLLNGWAVARNEGESALVVTEDGGQSWQIIEPTVR